MASNRLHIIARAFSTSSIPQKMVKPPIQIFGLEGRYATALYSAASKLKQLDVVEAELIKFQGTLKTDTKLSEFIKNPSLKQSLKVEALKQVTSSLKLSPPTTNLFGLLAENGRLKNLNAIINSFKVIMAAHRGEIPCEVTTAKPLDDVTKQELTAALKAFAKKGENILLQTKVDPNIIGGMVISIGDKYVDMSISSKIKKYSDLIQSAA